MRLHRRSGDSLRARGRRAELRGRLKEGALHRAERDRRLAQDWLVLEDEAWRTGDRVWICRRLAIAEHWRALHPPAGGLPPPRGGGA